MLSLTVRRWAVALPMFLVAPAVLSAQRSQPEFTRQFILVSNFGVLTPAGALSLTKADMRLGRKVADAVRDRLADLVNKKEARVISGYDIRESLAKSGIWPDTVLSLTDLHRQGQMLRADEMVLGNVLRLPDGVRVEAMLVLWRDTRVRQPVPSVTSADPEVAAADVARKIATSRLQLAYLRRCENALREGRAAEAMQEARAGIAASNGGILARTCLLTAMRGTGATPTEVLSEARAVLAVDSMAPHAVEAAATALDSLGQRDEAADMWLRLAATDSMNLEFVERVVWSMLEAGHAKQAEPLIVRVSDRNPDNLRLLRQKWRVTSDVQDWPVAVAVGDRLLQVDSEAMRNPQFYVRLAAAYKSTDKVYKAIETIARGVATFPQDPRLYALYAQYVKEESQTVIDRGLAQFPNSAEILALEARELRSQGKVAESLEASKKAMALDSTIGGHLVVAQSQIDLGQLDSALVTLHQAMAAGLDRAAIAQFALAKGNQLYRAAGGTKARSDYQIAMRFLAFADSLKSSPQTKFLLGAAAMSVAQTALTDAPKAGDREESCTMSQLGAESIPLARASLEAGHDVSPDAAKQFLDYLDQMRPYAERQVAVFCGTANVPRKGRT
ncbi:MAG TPA: hypothetical protein VJ867_01750 [Gemmatimonadaceae bacterium]|nr:hypothetical protein [Gemmatimonadaceae bacterium]